MSHAVAWMCLTDLMPSATSGGLFHKNSKNAPKQQERAQITTFHIEIRYIVFWALPRFFPSSSPVLFWQNFRFFWRNLSAPRFFPSFPEFSRTLPNFPEFCLILMFLWRNRLFYLATFKFTLKFPSSRVSKCFVCLLAVFAALEGFSPANARH